MNKDFPYTLLGNPTAYDITSIREAYDAALLSDHPRTQVGAVLGSARGYNQKQDHRDKYPDNVEFSRIHAETAAIINCTLNGWTARDHTMYAPWACCTGCATHILKAGIPRVVVHHEIMQLTSDKWLEEVQEGLDMLVRNNVRVEAVSKRYGITLMFDGKEVEV